MERTQTAHIGHAAAASRAGSVPSGSSRCAAVAAESCETGRIRAGKVQPSPTQASPLGTQRPDALPPAANLAPIPPGQRRARLRLPALLLTAALSACASAPRPQASAEDPRSGAVGVRSIDKLLVASDRMQLADNETFQLPLAEAGNAVPVYPPDLLAQRLPPQTVCLSLAIGADGAVFDSRPVGVAEGCPADAAADPRLVEAARAAVSRWRFDPAFRCVYPGPKPVDEQGCVTGREQAVAVSMAYSFVFEQRDGRGRVRIGG